MSRVLKKEGMMEAPDVRSLRSAWGAADDAPAGSRPATVDPELVALREETDRLRRQVDQQRAEISGLRAQAEAAVREAEKQAEARGREAGLREAEDDSAKRLVRLESGVERAVAEFVQALSALERLAPELARQGLAAMLGAETDRPALVAAIVQRQLRRLEAQAVVRVEVSAADFPDEAALSALAHALGAPGVQIGAESGLFSGDCRVRLKLGTMEIGLNQQWERLDALLRDLSQPVGGNHG
jgi:flagellar biosynthesis/type III secretory pathway protein FliH